ncbi:ABC transporter permease [Mesorhizobium sp. BH1-1-5]|uniref:ABC transporter permease n=1 Tax=Mesorhizobium sp. BH1-1-5 TaxID=2876661 RepID=UPI001CCC9574|nr:ABC transporter permease [Mesorhizobium sp. BH1-1-5]MBZ9987092.1 ABC transporter permease [Mesorhizobium sp. BH1-1-5]
MTAAAPIAGSTPARSHGIGALLAGRRESAPALVILVVLLIVDLWLNRAWMLPGSWGTVIGLAGPTMAAAIASMPSIMAGRGGIDVSIGPLMGFINIILIKVLAGDLGIDQPWVLVPVALAIGALVGLLNGLLSAVLRIQPIVATLGTYLVLSGVTLSLLPAPEGAAPAWLKTLAGPYSIVPLAGMAAIWLLAKRLTVYDWLMACGSDDRACFTAGVPVTGVRVFAYTLGGLFAGAGGLLLSALLGSADPNVGPTFTLVAISGVALGGVSLAGGRGGFAAAALGAAVIFLLQSTLTYFNVSSFLLHTLYGVILVASVSLNALTGRIAGGSR